MSAWQSLVTWPFISQKWHFATYPEVCRTQVILDVPLLGDERPRKFKLGSSELIMDFPNWQPNPLPVAPHWGHKYTITTPELIPFLKSVLFCQYTMQESKNWSALRETVASVTFAGFLHQLPKNILTLVKHCLLNFTSAARWGHSFKTQPCALRITKINLHLLVFCLWEERGGLTTSLKDLCSYRRVQSTWGSDLKLPGLKSKQGRCVREKAAAKWPWESLPDPSGENSLRLPAPFTPSLQPPQLPSPLLWEGPFECNKEKSRKQDGKERDGSQ